MNQVLALALHPFADTGQRARPTSAQLRQRPLWALLLGDLSCAFGSYAAARKNRNREQLAMIQMSTAAAWPEIN
jgi:hypothetical protein